MTEASNGAGGARVSRVIQAPRPKVYQAFGEGGTEVVLRYEDVPVGIRPEDNEASTRSALQKLAALLE